MKTRGIVLAILLAATMAFAGVPMQVSYQGQLTHEGSPVSGEKFFLFQIFDQSTTGVALWSDTDTLTVSNGTFDAFLGANTPLPTNIFTGTPLWLEITVQGETLSPRQLLASVPYSFRSVFSDTAHVALSGGGNGLWDTDGTDVYRPTGNVGIGTSSPTQKLDVRGNLRADEYFLKGSHVLNWIDSNSWRIMGLGGTNKIEINDTDVRLMDDLSPSSDGNYDFGTNSRRWRAVYADNYYGDGSNLTGISGTTDNDWTIDGNDVYHLTGNVGVLTTNPAAKLQVGGTLPSHTSVREGVQDLSKQGLAVTHGTTTDESSAILGANYNTIGNVRGVTGVVIGDGTPNGSPVGVFGLSAHNGAASGGASFGVFGRHMGYKQTGSAASVPAGVFGEGLSPSGIVYGVDAEIWSQTFEAAGLKAAAKADTGEAFGVHVDNASSDGRGVVIRMPGDADWGVDCKGRITATGGVTAKKLNAFEMTSSGAVNIYGSMAAQPLVEDIGRATLKDGMVRVFLDKTFLETVTVTDEHPLFVQVQANGPAGNLWVETHQDGFIVNDPLGSSAPITYYVKGTRIGMEGARLEKIDPLLEKQLTVGR